MNSRTVLIAALAAGVLAACGGGGGAGEAAVESVASTENVPAAPSGESTADAWASSKYAGKWQMCIRMSAPPYATSKLDTFELEAISPNVVSYRQNRTYHLNSGDCTLADGEKWADKRVVRGHGTFQLLGGTKVVDGVESERALWKSELPSDFDDADTTEKTTMGVKEDTLYLGDSDGPVDTGGFPDQYYHALRRLP